MRRLAVIMGVAGVILAGPGPAQAGVTRLSDSATFTTIQGAINDTGTSAGETLSVSAGTYAENVTIPQAKPNLKILGAGASSTTVDITGGGNAFTTYAPATITGFYITGPGRGSGTALKFVGDTSAGDRCSGT